MPQRLEDKPDLADYTSEPGTDSSSSHRLGWQLADTLKELLPERVRTIVYMHLGCRHYRRAISKTLESAAVTGIGLPEELANDIASWLEAYDGHPDKERITRLLTRIRCPTAGPGGWIATAGV
jgi:hypothetical protein